MIYEFQATQSFNGYEKPWPAGGGTNILPITVETHTYNGLKFDVITDKAGNILGIHIYGTTTSLVTELELGSVDLDPGTYKVNGCNSGTSDFRIQLKEGDISGISITQIYNGGYYTFTVTESETYLVTFVAIGNGATCDVTVYPQIYASTITDNSFTPYTNICPPEGFNIWDPTAGEFVQVYAGYVNANTRELYLRPVYSEYAGEELVGPWMSSWDPYEEDTTPTEGAFVIDFGGELTSFEITPFMLQTLLDSLGIRQHFTDGAGLLNSLMDQAQGRVRSEEELLHLSRTLKVIPIGDQLPTGLKIRPISKDVLPGLPGKFIR